MHPTLAILAGGASSRMGSPKSHLRVGEKFILPFLLDQFGWEGPTILVTAPGHPQPPGHERFTRVVADAVAHEGPLRGLLTALGACETAAMVLLPVDMPGVRRSHLDWLVDASSHRPEAAGLLLSRCDEGREQIEPFPSVYRRVARELISEHLKAGFRSLHSLTRLARFVAVASPTDWPAETWLNLNRPEDLPRFLSRRA